MAKSPSTRAHSKKKRRGQQTGKKTRGGLITGMRGGFKNVAGAVTGLDDERAKKKNAWLGTVVTLVIVALVAVFLMYR